MQHQSAKYLKVSDPHSGQCGNVFVAAHTHPNDPQVGVCVAPFAVTEVPNGQLGPIAARTQVHLRLFVKGEGPLELPPVLDPPC